MNDDDLSRILVAQPPLDHLGEEHRAQPEVGVLRWWSGRRNLSVVVKGTFAIGDDGRLSLAEEQEPLCLDRPSELGERGEVSYPSDFVPMKERVDVMLRGHAYALKKTERVEANLAVGRLSRSFLVVSEEPARELPLTAAHIRELDGGAAPGVGAVRRLELPELVAHDAPDASIYNAAPRAQQLDELAPDAKITLRGLTLDGKREVTLPGLVPLCVVSWGQGLVSEVVLRCDTVWIDTDRDVVVLVWRAPLEQDDEVEQLLVSMEAASRARTVSEVRRPLARGRFAFAAERGHTAMAPRVGTDEPDRARIGCFEALGELEGPEPTIALERYAAVSAELAEQREPRGDILKRHGFGEDAWLIEERAWLERMADDASRGDGELAARYGELFMAAQAVLTKPEELERTMSDWLSVQVALERAADPNEVFEKHDLTLAEWMRLDRRWRAACIADPMLEAQRNALTAELAQEQALATEDAGLAS